MYFMQYLLYSILLNEKKNTIYSATTLVTLFLLFQTKSVHTFKDFKKQLCILSVYQEDQTFFSLINKTVVSF